MNVSAEERQDVYGRGSRQEHILFAAFYILVSIVAVPGNTLALWAFCRQKSTSPSKVFLRNLAIADISYVLILPMRTVYHLSENHWPFGKIFCHLAGFLFYLNMYCSVYLMTFISLDRLLALVLPFRSRTVRKPKYAVVAVSILWITVIVSMSPLLVSGMHVTSNSTVMCTRLYLENASLEALVSTIVAFLIPLTTIVVSYLIILLKLRTVTQQEARPLKDKAVKMIVLIMMNFLFAFVPYHVSRVIYTGSSRLHVTGAANDSLALVNRITSALTCVSAVLDPIMYFFLANTYKDKLKWIFNRNRQAEQQTTNVI
ncbi:uracil nucleotide/cysteinyl leukotriene receptor [Lampris incognitus]|uniref:uracil nucleotide/cysteinyl leukotriene receptor n=1 Tax=Lampris incognitus TaxID=2546036 RepID=UPI0024B5559D|nr:uracil nucleotide/cysteinyl leukotriene receptor [Lampris incognitus]